MELDYMGQEGQIRGVEEHRLVGGKGDGMRLLEVRNGLGLAFTVSADRCADLSRLSLGGDNFGFFSAGGYVHPAYYDGRGKGSERSFTGGFLATCGLLNVGAPCVDAGEELPLHGAVGNLPAQRVSWEENGEEITIRATVRHCGFFGEKLILEREMACSKRRNQLRLTDRVRNEGENPSPLMLLYHMNLGYPLLSERAELYLPSARVIPRDPRAAEGLADWDKLPPPQPHFAEQCYFHEFDGLGRAGLYNPDLGKGFFMQFDTAELDCFTQWKMPGKGEYVLGLEPGNCRPGGRALERTEGRLKHINPGEEKQFHLRLDFAGSETQWRQLLGK